MGDLRPQNASTQVFRCHVDISLGKGNGYTGFIQGGINGQICLIQDLKILLRGDPVSHADIYT